MKTLTLLAATAAVALGCSDEVQDVPGPLSIREYDPCHTPNLCSTSSEKPDGCNFGWGWVSIGENLWVCYGYANRNDCCPPCQEQAS